MAAQKRVLMIQQGTTAHPIDYRDVVVTYQKPLEIPDLLVPLLGQVIEEIQTTNFVPTALKLTPLEKIDLGDLAAENEIRALDSYYVPTAQYQQAKGGHARLVVGRKGSGKTAPFYALRSTFRPIRSHFPVFARAQREPGCGSQASSGRLRSGGFGLDEEVECSGDGNRGGQG